jgi:hypothetical protein
VKAWAATGLVALGGVLVGVDAPPASPPPPPPVPGYIALIDGDILHANSLEFAGLALSDVVARPVLISRVLIFTGCRASAYGGAITGTITVNFDTNINRCVLDLQDLDLNLLTGELGAASDKITGKLSGHLELTVPTGKPELISGRGSLTVRDGNLVELSLLAVLLMGDPTGDRGHDRAEASFEIDQGRVAIANARVVLPNAQLLITGTIAFDGGLRLLVVPRVESFLRDFPLVGKWIGYGLSVVSSRVARTVIRGHLTKPVVVMDPFGD